MVGVSAWCSFHSGLSLLFTEDTTLSHCGISFIGSPATFKCVFLWAPVCFTLPKTISIFQTSVVLTMPLISKPRYPVLPWSLKAYLHFHLVSSQTSSVSCLTEFTASFPSSLLLWAKATFPWPFMVSGVISPQPARLYPLRSSLLPFIWFIPAM